jgi:FkbM family methyltransferase
MNIYFQIGTNNGNDNFKTLCMKNKPDIIILVEPNDKHLESIKKNYSNLKNVNIINKAIYYTDDEEVELFIPAINGIYGNIGKNNHKYTDGQLSLLPMNDWGDKCDMYKIKAKTITFDTICKKFNITNIDYLQIDTEGFDSEIISMINLNKYNIKKIRYEKWGFDKERFTKHNDNTKKLGKEGMKMVEEKLLKHGYVLNSIHDRYGNDIIAIK